MTVEERLDQAFRSIERVEPSADLWMRVVYSIDEDREHRRRVRRSIAAAAMVAVTVALATIVALEDGPSGLSIKWQTMELIETVTLIGVAAVLAPAIRRFGRGYAGDLWVSEPSMPTSLLRLLDVAYGLVIGGYILLSATFDSTSFPTLHFAEQLADACARLGGLLLLIGLLHATTMMSLPLVALVSNSTRRDRKLAKFVVVILVLAGGVVGLIMLQVLAGIVAVGSS